MITGNQVRLQRSVIIDALPLSAECSSHTPPAIVSRMKEYKGQAIPTSMMTGLEAMEATIKLSGSVAIAKTMLGRGFNKLVDVLVSDIGTIGDNGVPYAHIYTYAAKVKSLTPVTDDDGSEGLDIVLAVHGYSMKFDGVPLDTIDSRTGEITIGGTTIVEAVF